MVEFFEVRRLLLTAGLLLGACGGRVDPGDFGPGVAGSTFGTGGRSSGGTVSDVAGATSRGGRQSRGGESSVGGATIANGGSGNVAGTPSFGGAPSFGGRASAGGFGSEAGSGGVADSCVVPATHPTIQAALDDRGCPKVWVLAGVYAENLVVERDVSIDGGELGAVTITGSYQGRVLEVLEGVVELRSLVLSEGFNEEFGGGIYNAGDLLLYRTRVEGNLVEGVDAGGGGIFSEGNLNLVAAEVSRNRAARTGGEGPPYFPTVGGGIYMFAGRLELSGGSQVSENEVSGLSAFGGGIASLVDTFILDGSGVIGNVAWSEAREAEALGGGIAMLSGSLIVVDGSQIWNNEARATSSFGATVQGGGIFLSGEGDVSFSNGVEVSGNSAHCLAEVLAEASGGGVYTQNSLFSFSSRVADNRVEALAPDSNASGGGLHLRDAVLESSEINSNGATSNQRARGGGVYASGSLEVMNSTLQNNAVGDEDSYGGGIATGSALHLRVANSTFLSNGSWGQSLSGGGALSVESFTGQEDVDLANVTFSNNASSGDGGALYLDVAIQAATKISLRNSLFVDNRAVRGNDCDQRGVGIQSEYCLFSEPDSCPRASSQGDLFDGTLALLPPDHNGGPTPTSALPPGSPAIDAGDPLGCRDVDGALLASDQRGFPRNGRCDIGAFEYR